MSDGSSEPTVLDTTVLSNFAYIDRIDLLHLLPGVCTVPNVLNEIQDAVDSYPHLKPAIEEIDDTIPVVSLDEQEQITVSEWGTRLDPGEAEAFAVIEIRGGTLVTDDGPARTLAREYEFPVTGSIGVLIRAVGEGRMTEDEADRYLKEWIDATDYRAPSRDLADYLE